MFCATYEAHVEARKMDIAVVAYMYTHEGKLHSTKRRMDKMYV